MTTTVGIAYISTAVRVFSEAEMEHLLVDARAFNHEHNVTGVLLHHDGTFFQYIEGPADGIEAVYNKIKKAQRHRSIVELLREDVQDIQFSHWSMGCAEVSRNTILELERANWSKLSKQLTASPSSSNGLDLLLQFWHGSTRGLA